MRIVVLGRILGILLERTLEIMLGRILGILVGRILEIPLGILLDRILEMTLGILLESILQILLGETVGVIHWALIPWSLPPFIAPLLSLEPPDLILVPSAFLQLRKLLHSLLSTISRGGFCRVPC